MLAHGFTVEQIVELVRVLVATAHGQRVVAGGGGRTMEIARVKITEAGAKALADNAGPGSRATFYRLLLAGTRAERECSTLVLKP